MSEINQSDFAAAHERSDGQVVDVREVDEFNSGHVPGATSIPMGQLTDRFSELDKDRPVYVICQAGGRSSAMADMLTHHGYDAHAVMGGTGGWIADGRPVEQALTDGQ